MTVEQVRTHDATWRGVIAEYRDYLPLDSSKPGVTLLEGNTPLLRADRLAHAIGFEGELFLKFEGANPTGSFKDRGMTVAVTQAVSRGAQAIVCASTGNTSASAAAYAARAGIKALVVIPHARIAQGKLSQALMHGARIVAIDGGFDEALQIVRALGDETSITLVNSINPFRLEGQKTAAFEVCDRLGRAPDYHALPVGNAGNITAYWMGYGEYMRDGKIDALPTMLGAQAAGAAPIVHGSIVSAPQTVASAIRIGNPASWLRAKVARDESGGEIGAVTDQEILDAFEMVAATEGVFAEPASAAGVAFVRKLATERRIRRGSVVVCTLTGHGLKDPAIAIERCEPPVRVGANVEDVIRALRL